MLEIKNLHVCVGEREILKGLDLTVKDGEVAAIMGPNGTGLSTLSYVIAGREGYEVTRDGEVLALTPTEYRLLIEFVDNVGMALDRATLLDRVWGYGWAGDTRLVDVHVQRLRAKIEADPASPDLVQTVRGVGYKLVRPSEDP